MDGDLPAPRQFLGVMVSSTFRFLEGHRAALMRAIEAQDLHAVAMEQDAALPDGSVIDSSLRKVGDAAAYIGVIGYRYGQVPDSAELNPGRLSLTELEFREARRLGRPMLIFIMGPEHDIKYGAVEQDPEKIPKLNAFREEVKRVAARSGVERVYKVFNSLREFEVAAMQSVADLRRLLDEQQAETRESRGRETGRGRGDDGIPRPPVMYAVPRYAGSHEFVGRAAELDALRGWAGIADRDPVFLFTAIGGTGKSMLAWEWAARSPGAGSDDWAGRMWYSFYDKSAVMAGFCRRALAYMTGRPPDAFAKLRQPELADRLMQQMQARPWLLVLDGLERILVAYHRHDAAQLADEDADGADQVASRDASAAIRPHDDELLRDLASAAPSKILITSRLMPHALLNKSGQVLPGIRHQHLAGLRADDAEALLRGCGIHGSSRLIQDYLRQHCGCHPLVTGIIAGLVSDYLPARGHFDAWAADPAAGGRLNLADLNMVQKRHHILQAALDALTDKDRQLLSTLALLPDAVDYGTLTALNPHMPPEPQPPQPWPAESLDLFNLLAPGDQDAEERRLAGLERQAENEQKRQAWLASPDVREAPSALARTVRDLERRGLLQYDRQASRYDLHPVVRGYAAGTLGTGDRDRLGQRAIDYFNQQPLDQYEQAETLDDVSNGLQLTRTLLQIGRPFDAHNVLTQGLASALLYNLEAYAEILSVYRPFFTQDWTALSPDADDLTDREFTWLASCAVIAFFGLGQMEQALTVAETELAATSTFDDLDIISTSLANIGRIYIELRRFSSSDRAGLLDIELVQASGSEVRLFVARLRRFQLLARMGRWADAEAAWQELDPMGRDWPRNYYRPGDAEAAYATARFWQGCLTEDILAGAGDLARAGRNRRVLRVLCALRGQWHLQRGEWVPAGEHLREAIRMTRETGLRDTELEADLALARFRLGQLPDGSQEADRLSTSNEPAHLALACLWHALGDPAKAAEHATAAYKRAWGEGEPYVHRYELTRATTLLEQLGAEIPCLPPYDAASDQPLALENQIRAVIHQTTRTPQRRQTKKPAY